MPVSLTQGQKKASDSELWLLLQRGGIGRGGGLGRGLGVGVALGVEVGVGVKVGVGVGVGAGTVKAYTLLSPAM